MSDPQATEFVQSAMPLCASLGIEADEASTERIVLTLAWRPELCTTAGLLHGGAVMALADAAGGASAFLNLPEGAVGTSTIESKTNFLGAVKEGAVLVATAQPLHVGRATIVVETELRVGDRLVAKTTQTQAVLRERGGT